MKFLTKSALVFLGLVAAANVNASVITYDGEDVDIGAGWRNSTVPKAYSVNGSNVYGLDGYFTSNSTSDGTGTITNSLPSYVASAAVASPQTYSSAGYEAIDNPTPSSPYFDGMVYSGTAYVNAAAAGATENLLTFTLSTTAAIPAGLRIGVMVDNTDNSGGQNPRPALTLSGGTGGTATAPIGVEDGIADWYFFDITSAAAGDVYNISETNTSTGNENLQAGLISFDTVTGVPEPSACALMAVGGIVLVFILRRLKLVGPV
jgi:hypothetical protein